jgi:hypothetical protein
VGETSIAGAIEDLSGSCPAIGFAIGDLAIVTDLDTEFARGLCADVAAGMAVDVKGVVREGVLRAQRLELPLAEHQPHHDAAAGAIAGLAGACPDRAFTIDSIVVTVDGLTD